MTYAEAYKNAKNILKKSLNKDYVFDAYTLFEYVFNISKTEFPLYQGKEAPNKACQKFFDHVRRRAANEPLQYILGYWYFMGKKFFLGEGALIPRDDTEVLVKKSANFLKSLMPKTKKAKVLDLCSGTGVIAINLADMFKNSEILAVELYDTAIEYLNKNLKYNKVKNVKILKWDVLNSKLPSNLEKNFDLIVANPPYIKSNEINYLQEEVKREPREALDGGKGGLDFYRAILSRWKIFLKSGGGTCVEIGYDQASDVKHLFRLNGFRNVETIKDINSLNRVVFGMV